MSKNFTNIGYFVSRESHSELQSFRRLALSRRAFDKSEAEQVRDLHWTVISGSYRYLRRQLCKKDRLSDFLRNQDVDPIMNLAREEACKKLGELGLSKITFSNLSLQVFGNRDKKPVLALVPGAIEPKGTIPSITHQVTRVASEVVQAVVIPDNQMIKDRLTRVFEISQPHITLARFSPARIDDVESRVYKHKLADDLPDSITLEIPQSADTAPTS